MAKGITYFVERISWGGCGPFFFCVPYTEGEGPFALLPGRVKKGPLLMLHLLPGDGGVREEGGGRRRNKSDREERRKKGEREGTSQEVEEGGEEEVLQGRENMALEKTQYTGREEC